MQSVLECLPPESRVAILRLRSLGDCVLTTPAIQILKQARPDVRVAVVVEDRFRDLFGETLLRPDAGALRAWRPDLCLNLHGGTRSAWMTALSGARFRAGFRHYRWQGAYNVRIPRAQEILGVERTVHTAEHLASAVFYLGVEPCEIPRARLVGQALCACPGQVGDLPYVGVIHPVAATPEKSWRADGFVAVAEHLKQAGIEPVFIGAAADDLSPFRAYRTISGAPLSRIKNLLAGAALFLGNDSGPAHMAAAFGLPVVVIFGASDPAIWGPWRTASEVVTAPGGIRNVAIGQVIEALARLRVHV